jgi:phosphatidylinositol alpha-1,6-mannosyltransferase
MKITFIVRDINTHGGIQSFAKQTAVDIKKDHRVTLLDWHTPHSYFQEGLVRVLPTPVSRWLYDKWFVQDISVLLRGEKPDLIHFWHIKSPMATIQSLQQQKIPYVVTCHGSEVLKEMVGKYQQHKFLAALEGAYAITTPSTFTKDYIVREYLIPKEKIHVIPPGIDIDISKSKKTIHNNKQVTIGTVTRLVKRKNVLNVIEALTILQKQGLVFTYKLAGTGSKRMRFMVLRKLRKVPFKWNYDGNMSDQTKWETFYPSLDVFVLPPLARKGDIEGFGIVFLEANSFGVPVVASKTGGVVDAVKEGVSGVFADPHSPQDIAAQIGKLLSTRDSYKTSMESWVGEFSPAATRLKLGEVYKAVIR